MKSSFLVCIVLIFVSAATMAQQPAPTPGEQTPTQQPLPPQHPEAPPAATPAAKPPQKITKEQADELFRSVDELMKFASSDTGLPIKSSIKRQLVSRDQVQKYIEDHFKDDADEKRFQRSEVVLKKFGLLPRAFDLQPFLIQLLREQIAGYYDPKKKTVYMLDWLDADTQRPVLAHELTHALQDQAIDLQHFMKEPKTHSDNEAIASDEDSTARTALVEGQGMAVFLDYLLRSTGHTIADEPKVVDMMRSQMESGGDSPMLSKAPLLLRESLLFPYREGLGFVQALLEAGGKARAFPQALELPPHDSREIMVPRTYLDHQRVDPQTLPDMKKLFDGAYEKYDIGAIGEFDVELLAEQFADRNHADAISSAWRGGAYYAALRKGAKAPYTTADLALAYVSRWSSPKNAERFAGIYAAGLKQRYTTLKKVSSTRWQTEEGEVSIEPNGDQLLILESFEPAVADRLRAAFADQSGPRQVAGAGDLSLTAMRPVFALPVTLLPRVKLPLVMEQL